MKTGFTQMYRMTVFLPSQAVNLRQDMLEGVQAIVRLGDDKYDLVHWSSGNVTERFRPLAGARPATGRSAELQAVHGEWLVFLLPRDPALLDRVLQEAVLALHPWEAPGVTVDEVLLPLKQEG